MSVGVTRGFISPAQSHEGQLSIPGTIPTPKQSPSPGKWENNHLWLQLSYNTSISCVHELGEVQMGEKKDKKQNKIQENYNKHM